MVHHDIPQRTKGLNSLQKSNAGIETRSNISSKKEQCIIARRGAETDTTDKSKINDTHDMTISLIRIKLTKRRKENKKV